MRKAKKVWLQLIAASSIVTLGVIAACTKEGRAKDKPTYVFKENGPAGALFSIEGKNYSLSDFSPEKKAQYMELAKQMYELQLSVVDDTALTVAYGDKAKAANMSVDEYVQTKVMKEPKISDAEYKKFVEEKKIPKEQLEQLKPRIMEYMKAQKMQAERQVLVAQVTKKNPPVLYFTKPNLRIDMEVGDSPAYGDANAKVTIVEFSDFQCPFCTRAAETVNQLKKQYKKNQVRIVFKHYPLPMHPRAKPASEASMCVHEQNADKFWTYHDILFKNASKLEDADLKKYAKDVGVDEKKFAECYDSKKYAQHVEKDMEYGNSKGVRSTPSFYINGIPLQGAQPIEKFKEIIDEELAAAK